MAKKVKLIEPTPTESLDLGAILDALKELTTAIADLKKEQVKLGETIHIKVKAGKF